MEIVDWKKLFAPHILSRGLDYYESELVKIESMDDEFIEAVVEGTEPYSVEIVLKNSRVKQMDCDCPYAADGNNCKHMAAVLFAVDDADRDVYSPTDELALHRQKCQKDLDNMLTQAISALPEDQLRALLITAAQTHSDIRDRIMLIGKAAAAPSMRKRWAAQLHEITRRASDRHGFIDYDHASDYSVDLNEYLDETIAPLLENRLVMDAFDLVGLVFAEAMSQEIDDSDGGLSSIACSCASYWEELIPSPEANQPKMLDWFQAQIQCFSGDVGEDYLWPVVFEHFTDPKLMPKILAMLDKRIESANDYSLKRLVVQRIRLMEQAGATAEEIDGYRKRFWEQPFIRGQELDRLEAEGLWKDALDLLRECEALDATDPFLLSEYSARRIRLLKQAGPESAWLNALKQHIFGFPQHEMTYIIELKQAVPAEQWPALLQQLFQDKNTRGLRRELQLSEGMLEQMMSELEASPYPYELVQYESVLRKVYPERVRDLRLRQLDAQMRQASTRNAYARTVQALKHLYGYPAGREKAAELAAGWRRDYPRRSAMLEELKKAKL